MRRVSGVFAKIIEVPVAVSDRGARTASVAAAVLAGDEVMRTQKGNNNTWCQDNELNWFDWTLLEKNKDVLEFVKKLIAFRQRAMSLAWLFSNC